MKFTVSKKFLISAWLWLTGLTCFAMPFFWWPRPFTAKTALLVALFLFVLWLYIQTRNKGRIFDDSRTDWHGYLSVIVFSGILFSSILAYRWLLL
jgi:hypothetical protein